MSTLLLYYILVDSKIIKDVKITNYKREVRKFKRIREPVRY